MKTPGNRKAQRSGLYSQSKFTNWSDFDPYEGEIALRRAENRTTFQFAEAECVLAERPLHTSFIRPFSTTDIIGVLSSIPTEFLQDLNRVVLLGGTRKQELTALGPIFRWGQYNRPGNVYLFAYPRRAMTLRWRKPPSTELLVELEYAKPNVRRDGGRWLIEFTAEGLREFYLFDVLLHEIGHHVDRNKLRRSSRKAEYYAEWFAERFGRPLRRARTSVRLTSGDQPNPV